MTRGFFTIATGDRLYKKLAYNLLLSYRYHTSDPLPFAILTDLLDEYTETFDVKVVMNNPCRNYYDKIEMLQQLPFDENIFIESDVLAYSDLNILFDIFKGATDISFFGKSFDTDSDGGWYNYNEIPVEYQNRVSKVIGLHGGICFLRKSNTIKKMYEDCKDVLSHRDDFHFKIAADEPIYALVMAMNDCVPTLPELYNLYCWWHGPAHITHSKYTGIPAVHWGTKYTKTFSYKKQVYQLTRLSKHKRPCFMVMFGYDVLIFMKRVKDYLYSHLVLSHK